MQLEIIGLIFIDHVIHWFIVYCSRPKYEAQFMLNECNSYLIVNESEENIWKIDVSSVLKEFPQLETNAGIECLE